jgi:hypothetical protein
LNQNPVSGLLLHRANLTIIAAYCLVHLIDSFIRSTLLTHMGHAPFLIFGKAFETFLLGTASLLVLWLILFRMYRRKIFLRI